MLQTFDIGSDKTRKVQFKMDLDPYYPQDAVILHFLRTGVPPEPELCHLMLRALRPGDLMIDGGANIGFFSLLGLSCGARVIAVEPCRKTVEKLEANFAANAFRRTNYEMRRANYEIFVAALVEHDASPTVQFYEYPDSGLNACWGDRPCINVPTCVLDVFSKPRLLKLDIEGSELRALQGGVEILSQSVPFVVVECNSKALDHMHASVPEIRELMQSLDYSAFKLSPDGDIPALIPDNVGIDAMRDNSNLLFSTPEHVAEAWPRVEI